MRRSARLAVKQSKLANETRTEPKTKKSRSDDKISNIATLDNDTMVEVFKSLNYCQLAKNSIVSKRFCDLIQTHRHKLALFYVDIIETFRKKLPTKGFIEIFDNELSPEEEYNKWVIWNGYSKRVSGKRRTLYEGRVYQLNAYADYNAPNHRRAYTGTSVFHACVELNNRNWPFFQHFVRLLFDPFVYIRSLKLDLQNDVLNLLAGAMNTHHGRIQCRELTLKFGGNAQEFMSALKDHVLCDEFHIWIEGDSIWVKEYGSNYDKEMLDLCNSGNHCASAICVKNYDLSTVIANLVQRKKVFLGTIRSGLGENASGKETDRGFGDVGILSGNDRNAV